MINTPGYFSQTRLELIPFLPSRRSRVLEVGCADGSFLSHVDGISETWGIEPSSAADVANTRLFRVIQSTFDDAAPSLPKNYFDLVVCNDVIEHLPDHDTFLEDIKNFLVPGGAIIGSIPNMRFYDILFRLLFEKEWTYMDEGILDKTHLRFFTERSLKDYFLSHGFNIELFSGLHKNLVLHHHSNERKYRILSRILVKLFPSSFADTQFLQFGFRIRLKH